jgi:AAA+ superfamily predicted ATPase
MTLPPSLQEIDNLISARVPIVWVLTSEEGRFLTELSKSVIAPKSLNLSVWSMTSGIERVNKYRSQEKVSGTENIMKALQAIVEEPIPDNNAIYILRDFFPMPPEVRYLRDIYETLAEQGKTLIITSPFLAHGPGGQKEGLPPTLEKQVCVVEYALPARKDILQRVRNVTSKLNNEYTDTQLDEICRAVRGLTTLEIDNALSSCLAEKGKLEIDFLIHFKRQSIRKSQILEFMDTNVDVDDVGGLDKAKEYFDRYKNCFGSEAVEFGVEPLKLVLLTGIAGTGKSLICKTIGNLFKLPLVKLDIGRVYGSLVGQSESRMREVIRQIEGLSPVVVMIDEIEKGLSGTGSSGQRDNGTTDRVFGTLLTAIQDGLKEAILIGTANNIASIPPEFIRRANEVFFVDLPSQEERWDIFKIHIEKRGRKFKSFAKIKFDFLNMSKGFTGAEIEKAVKDAIARAFYDKSKNVTGKHILDALSEIKPISQVRDTEIKELQKWAKDHARYASSHSERPLVSSKTDSQTTSRLSKISSKLN